MGKPVTDPAVLRQLGASKLKPVTDPAILKQLNADKKPAAAPPKERSWLDYGKQALRSAGQGILDLNDQFQSVINPGQAIMQNIARQQGHKMPTQAELARASGGRIAEKIGLHGLKDMTPGEKVAFAGVRGAAPALITGGAGGAANLARELVGGALSGMATEGTKQAGGGEVAQTIAGLAGGVSPNIAEAGVRGLSNIAAHTFLASGKDAATRTLKGSTDDVARALSNIEKRPTPLPGINPTTAEVAGDASIGALERGHMSQPLYAQKRANLAGLTGALDEAGGTGNVQQVQNFAQRAENRLKQGISAAVNRFKAPVVEEVSGEAGRAGFKAGRAASRAGVTQEYNHPALNTDFELPDDVAKSVHSKLFQIRSHRYDTQAGPAPSAVVDNIHSAIDEFAGNLTNTKSIVQLDRKLASQQHRLTGNDAGFVRDMREAIANEVIPHAPPEFNSQWMRAKATMQQHGATYTQSKLGKLMRDDYGTARQSDEVLGKQLVPKNEAGGKLARELQAAMPGSPIPENLGREEIARVLEKKLLNSPVDASGRINRIIPESELVAYRQYARKFPELQKDVNALIRANKQHTIFSKGPIAKLIPPLTDPEAHIGKLISGGKSTARELKVITDTIKASGDPDAIAGMQRLLANHIDDFSKSGSLNVGVDGKVLPDTDRMYKATSNILDAGEGILTDEQKRVFEAVKQHTGGMNVAQKSGVSPEQPMNLGTIPLPLAGKPRAIWKTILTLGGSGRKGEKVLQRALKEPDFAAELLKRPTHARLKALSRSMRHYTTGAATPALGQSKDEEQ